MCRRPGTWACLSSLDTVFSPPSTTWSSACGQPTNFCGSVTSAWAAATAVGCRYSSMRRVWSQQAAVAVKSGGGVISSTHVDISVWRQLIGSSPG